MVRPALPSQARCRELHPHGDRCIRPAGNHRLCQAERPAGSRLSAAWGTHVLLWRRRKR